MQAYGASKVRRAALATAGLLAVGSILILAALPVQGAKAKSWATEREEDFRQGEIAGTRISSKGSVTLGPKAIPVEQLDVSFIWNLVTDASGNTFVGTGSDGKVFRLDGKGQQSGLLADLPEDQVFAMTPGPRGSLFAATSPDGKVYKITPDGEAAAYFEPEVKYIWSLAYDASSGNLYAGTGEGGKIYKITGAGNAEEYFDTGEIHVTALAMGDDGHLFAGTVEHGYVFRIEPGGKKGRVIYDSRLQEIRTLLISRKGDLLIVAADGPSFSALQPEEQKKKDDPEDDKDSKAKSVSSSFFSGGTSPKGEIVALGASLAPERIFGTDGEMILAIAQGPGEEIYVATAESILSVHGRENADLLYHSEDALITCLAGVEPGVYLFCSSNEGAVYRLDASKPAQGTFTSKVKDAYAVVEWGALTWQGTVPEKGNVQFFVRSGNTETPDLFWSDWSGPLSSKQGEALGVPPGQFCQFKVDLQPGAAGAAPEINRVALSFREPNRPPVFKRVNVHSPDVIYAGAGKSNDSYFDEEDEATIFTGYEEDGKKDDKDYGKRKRRRGARTITWEVSDPDGDRLEYEVRVRMKGSGRWMLMKGRLREEVFSWDSTVLPDGEYVVQVSASDLGGNPPERALTAAMESESFVVDHTPPEINGLKVEKKQGGAAVVFRGSDKTGVLQAAAYSIDGRKWLSLLPEDGILDQPEESFRISLDAIPPGEHLVVVRIVDDFNNAKARFIEANIPAGKR